MGLSVRVKDSKNVGRAHFSFSGLCLTSNSFFAVKSAESSLMKNVVQRRRRETRIKNRTE